MILRIKVPDWEPKVEEIWPDGDWPLNPTEGDLEKKILEEIQEYGSVTNLLSDWNLLEEVELWLNNWKIYPTDDMIQREAVQDGPPEWAE